MGDYGDRCAQLSSCAISLYIVVADSERGKML